MPNKWVTFVKEYAKENNKSYFCSICEIKEQGLYKTQKQLKEEAKKPKVKIHDDKQVTITKKKKQPKAVIKEDKEVIIKKKTKKPKMIIKDDEEIGIKKKRNKKD